MRIAFPALVLALAASPSRAQSPFDGTWRLDPGGTPASPRLFELSLRRSFYGCRSCRPAWSVRADGRFHAVANQSGFDEASVQIVSDRIVSFRRRLRGREVYEATDTVSADGNTLSFTWRETSASGVATSGTGIWDRVLPGAPDAHGLAGSWRERQPDTVSDAALTFAITIEGDTMQVTGGTGESYRLRFGGPPVEIAGDRRGTRVSARRLSRTVVEETDFRDGQIVSVRTETLTDPATMEILIRNRRSGEETRMVARRR
jgi:hypothetical protein